MRKLSIKNRVALWYAFSILAVITLTVALLLAMGDSLILDENEKNLMAVTDRAVKDIRVTGGELVIDDDISYLNNDVYVVICRDDGTVISGLTQKDFPALSGFDENMIRKVPGTEKDYYVYDRLIENQKTGRIWVRGITSAELSDMAPAVVRMLTGFMTTLPILLLISLIGGRMITKQAFAPLNKIIDTAERIRLEGDMSGRIGIGDKDDSDEVRRTAAVIDEMLDQIESNFENEKRFTNNASHELRTPVAVILAQSDYALANLDDPEEVEESLKEIRRQAGSMSSLITQLLRLSRADRGIEQLKMEVADVSIIAEESASRHMRDAAAKNITINTDAEEECYMSCNEVFLGRMFDNLIDNAVKYGKAGGRVDVSVKKENGRIRAVVADDGIGINKDELAHIWDKFYRGSMTGEEERGTEDSRSMGLGLSLVQWIVKEHGGEITVRSEPGIGSEFTMILPENR